MIRKHDRYVLKAFWANFLAVVFFLTLIVLVLDISDRLARVNRHWEGIKAAGFEPGLVLVEYYATLIPFVWLRILPFCVPLAAAFCLSRLNRHNELTPLLTTGVSMRRIVAPIVISGVIVAGGMLVVREYLVPKLSRHHMKVGRVLSKSKPNRIARVPHFHDKGGARLSMAAFLPIDQVCEGASVSYWDPEGRPTRIERYPELTWDGTQEHWVATSGGQRIPLGPGETGLRQLPIPPGTVVDLEAHVSLLEISLTRARTAGLSFTELRALVAANPTNARFEMLFQELITVPVSVLVLLLLALPFCVHAGRESALPGLLNSLGIMALYFGATFLLASIGGAGEMHPVVLAWLPTAIFGSLGLALFLGME